jgi:DNA-binding Xre family transcriptional regulator
MASCEKGRDGRRARTLAVDDDLRREALILAVAARIDLLMAQQAISQAELALRAGVHRITINRSLQGRGLSLATIDRLAAALDCDVVVDLVPRTAVNSL